MDGGAWGTAVHQVSKSWTWLKWLSRAHTKTTDDLVFGKHHWALELDKSGSKLQFSCLLVLWLETDIFTYLRPQFLHFLNRRNRTSLIGLLWWRQHKITQTKPRQWVLTLTVLNEYEFLSASSALCMELPVASHSFVISTAAFSLGVFARAQLKWHHREPLMPFEFFIPESQATDSHVSFH